MTKTTRQIILTLFIILSAFIFYSRKIINNKVFFNTDEAYWISTAKIIPLLWKHRLNDPFWNEYYGFVNFNGAKFIYGIGLTLQGITDVSLAGTAPATYYKWETFGGKPFPRFNHFYSILIRARLISSLFTSIAVGLIFIFVFQVSRKIFAGLVAAFMVLGHPIIMDIATHALSDGFFLLFQMIFLIFIILLSKKQTEHLRGQNFVIAICLGLTLAWITAVKLNGLMFLALTIVFLILNTDYSLGAVIKAIFLSGMVFLAMIFFFLLLEPNLFFFPKYTFSQMLSDRIMITNQHIVYFSRINPGHVILSLPEKLRSFGQRMFPLWLWPLFIPGILTTLILVFRSKTNLQDKIYGSTIIAGILTWGIVLTYVVFDEPRYYLPVLPFVMLVAVNWINYLNFFSRPVLQRLGNMRKFNSIFS